MRSNAIPMVGKKYGHLTVIANAGRRMAPSGQYRRMVRVVCDCGHEYVAHAQAVRVSANRCRACANIHLARHSREVLSVRLNNGRTIAQVAAAAGVSVNTAYRRWLRGWPERKLGLPLRHGSGGRGFGGSVDLPERRRTIRADVRP